ncbi:MAG: hypothetical protein ACUVX8_03740 [Candidatus Zipacnadales bacterium]
MSNQSIPLMPAYIASTAAQRADNHSGRNHWSVYLREICDQLGLKAYALDPEALTPHRLSGLSALLLPAPSGEWLNRVAHNSLHEWVETGGTLVGCGVTGFDELFGVRATNTYFEQADDFSPAAGLIWRIHPITQGVLWELHPTAPAPVLAPARLCEVTEAEVLADLVQLNGASTPCPAVTYRRVGKGAALYIAFDLAQHMWVAHHGRPVDADYDGDGFYRLSDAIPARDFEPEVPYADQLLFLVRNVLARTGQPFIAPIPPASPSGEPADILVYWGGDDEAAAGTQLVASNFMREVGLPYHINLMPDKQGRFAVSKAEFDAIKANGHETSLHYDFQTGFEHPYAFSEAEVLQQAQWYEEAFNERAACSVFHWCHWTGWSEPAEWMLKAGGCGDNSRIHRGSPPLNPTNLIGYSFGTSFPYHFYRDWRGGNARLPFISEPITLYECGYDRESNTAEFSQLHRGLEMALRYQLTTDCFFHPICLASYSAAREAVQEVVRWLAEHGASTRHMGNDELAYWWFARSQSRVRAIQVSANSMDFTVECDWPEGCVVQVPMYGDLAKVESSRGELRAVVRHEPGGQWIWITCPSGKTAVRVCQR